MDAIRVLDTTLFGKRYHWVDRLAPEKIERDGLPGIKASLHKGRRIDCQECRPELKE
jgi:hypothetical protein